LFIKKKYKNQFVQVYYIYIRTPKYHSINIYTKYHTIQILL